MAADGLAKQNPMPPPPPPPPPRRNRIDLGFHENSDFNTRKVIINGSLDDKTIFRRFQNYP